MTTRSHRDAVLQFLRSAARRVAVRRALQGASAALLACAVVYTALGVTGFLPLWVRPSGAVASVLASAALVGAAVAVLPAWWHARRDATWIARRVERRTSGARNAVLTAVELEAGRTRTRGDIAALVWRAAAGALADVNAASLFPTRRRLALFAGSAALALIAATLSSEHVRGEEGARRTAERAHAPTVHDVQAVVATPAYAGGATVTLNDPTRIEALAGSNVTLTVRANADSVVLETLSTRAPLVRVEDGVFRGEFMLDADGFVALEPREAGGRTGVRRIISVAGTPDAPPRVRVVEPGRDLFLAAVLPTVALTVEADDDIALTSLRLRYTRVSGSGEQFTFTDGEVPVVVERDAARAWRASGTLRLDSLGLERGDMVVYRGVATDNRPGSVPAESDTYIIEILGPGAVAAEGFSADDEQDRYGFSQQMVIVRTERLVAQRASMDSATFAREALTLAAEQRRVRAEFVFMLGGEQPEDFDAELDDHDHEHNTAGEDDILAGRLANRGRIDLLRAIRSMSHAAGFLTGGDLDQALPAERAALDALQRAFARTRYILRALTERERLDLSRRLTGTLDGALRDVRPLAEPAPDPRVSALRGRLSDLAAVAGAAAARVQHQPTVADIPDPRRTDAVTASLLAQQILAVDPASAPLQRIAAQLSRGAGHLSARRDAPAAATLDSAVVGVAEVVRALLARAPAAPMNPLLRALDAARTDALQDAISRGTR